MRLHAGENPGCQQVARCFGEGCAHNPRQVAKLDKMLSYIMWLLAALSLSIQ